MAISAACVWEVRTTGNDTNGGGFVTGAAGADYSQQDGKRTAGDVTNISTTDAVANGTTTLTSATANFDADIVGNIIYLQGGSGGLAIVRRQVTARTNATTITVDATVAAGTGITMNIGGALASPGEMGRNWVNSNTGWIKAGTYTISSTTGNVTNGLFSRQDCYLAGYQTVREDWGTPPLLQANGVITNFSIISTSGFGLIRNINVDGNSRTSSRGFSLAANTKVGDCKAVNCTNCGFSVAGMAINCIASGCTTQAAFAGAGSFFGCVAKDGSSTGFSAPTIAINCIADTLSGASTDGFVLTGATPVLFMGCVAYTCGRDGFRVSATTTGTIVNCIAEDNTGIGFNGSTSNPDGLIVTSCGAFSNGTDFGASTGKLAYQTDNITGSSSFFTNAAGGDFSLNNTAGAGADLRASGYSPTWNEGLTPSFPDIGVAQHQDTGGGGGGEHSAVF